MQLTYGELSQVRTCLARLSEMKFPAKVSLDIAIISHLVDAKFKAFTSVRDKLYKDYSIKLESGDKPGAIRFVCADKDNSEKNLTSFQVEFNELLETKADDMQFKKIQIPSEIKGEVLQIEPAILLALTEFVEVV